MVKVKCCLCSNSGVCKNCVCARNGVPCSNCNPGRLDRCHNLNLPGGTPAATPAGNSGTLTCSHSTSCLIAGSSLPLRTDTIDCILSGSSPPAKPVGRLRSKSTKGKVKKSGAGDGDVTESGAGDFEVTESGAADSISNACATDTLEISDSPVPAPAPSLLLSGAAAAAIFTDSTEQPSDSASVSTSTDVGSGARSDASSDAMKLRSDTPTCAAVESAARTAPAAYHSDSAEAVRAAGGPGETRLPSSLPPPSLLVEPLARSGCKAHSGTRPGANPSRLAPSRSESAEYPATTPIPSACAKEDGPHFAWGPLSGAEFAKVVDAAYAESVHWRRNVFNVPSGREGKEFVSELTRLVRGYAEASALEFVAIKAAMVLPLLALQKPWADSKTKDHCVILGRRLRAWKQGDINGLVREGRVIQQHLTTSRHGAKEGERKERVARAFARLMFKGRVRSALRLVSDLNGGGVLDLDDKIDGISVRDVLKSKHPAPAPVHPETLLQADERLETHSVLFDRIDGKLIRSVALTVQGSAGPSGIDAAGWRRLCTSFGTQSKALCSSLAAFTKRICTSLVDPDGLSAFVACRLIPLDKMPGVRPIGICEVMRRIVGKTIMRVVGQDVRKAVGPLQLCAGLDAGCEAAVHAMQDIFQDDNTEGVLLVDAKNAFNTINRQAALQNAQALCPSIASALINIYRGNAELFVGGETIYSCEGTTQGDPMAMSMYALAVVPLIHAVSSPDAQQVWFADDATAGGKLKRLRYWWDALSAKGPAFGYSANCDKSWLVVKDGYLPLAKEVFDGTGVRISQEGRRHLGSALGTESFVQAYITEKVKKWTTELEHLSVIAESEPHAAYAALTHGLMGHWIYFLRTINGIAPMLQPLEDVLRQKFLPALTGREAPGDTERNLLGLPVRYGGLGLLNPTTLGDSFEQSRIVTAPLVALIVQQSSSLGDAPTKQRHLLTHLHSKKRQLEKIAADAVLSILPPDLHQAAQLSSERGASSWLSVLPLTSLGLTLHKGAFRDALCLRYGWTPAQLPSTCICGGSFTIAHALSCPTGGFPTLRHNEVRDMLADLMTEVAHDIRVEPPLQPLTGEVLSLRTATTDDGARLDLAASGLWGGRFERAFFDVRVINPLAVSNQSAQGSTCYRRHEADKRRKYQQRVLEIEHSSFVPFVVSATGGLGPAATTTLQRLALLLAESRDQPYCLVMGWLRCRFAFALLRSAIMCLRGARSAKHRPVFNKSAAADLAVTEARIPV